LLMSTFSREPDGTVDVKSEKNHRTLSWNGVGVQDNLNGLNTEIKVQRSNKLLLRCME